MKRALIVAHGHPDLSTGGGEIAAYQSCRELRRRGIDTVFMARAPGPAHRGGTPFSTRPNSPRDMLFHSPDFDHFLLSQRAKWAIYEEFRSFLDRFQPDAVFFHHYLFLGLEMIREVRKYSTDIPIFLTLHEYMAICNNLGQMVKTDGRLCRAAASFDCHQCFPDHSPQDFFMRELFIKSHLAVVDRFIAPSKFLKDRYVGWGIEDDRIVVLENGQPGTVPVEPPTAADTERLSRSFAFFGQISALKGIFVLLDAAKQLPKKLRKEIRISIFGSMQYETDLFKAQFHEAVKDAGVHVRFNGPYVREDLPSLMRSVGWIVVPSIWWENSPLVIQEALSHGRPVVCSDIGGMAEKVRDGETGLHFRTGDAISLAARIEQAADPALWQELQGQIKPPPTIEETVNAQLALYNEIRTVNRPKPVPVQRRPPVALAKVF